MKKLFLLSLIVLFGCSSAEMVDNWKNPDIVIFDASKVLLVGMTQNEDARVDFESRLKKEFDVRGVESVRSVDVFDVAFTNSKRTEKELDAFEQQLLDKDFDAILLTKIVGSETKQPLRKTIAQLYREGDGFKEDYRRNQDIYYDEEYYERYTIYHAETSLYCICVDKERSLIWRGNIDLLDPEDIEKTVEDYVDLIITAMEEQDLIFRGEKKGGLTGS
ncbi:hypothetical protein FK220_010255 [Flavobacteriaceae bacterium TP-CH-4]|uniref:Cardiolipin synthetase n=1 Tax=Pelagihabitans pacificus TaxID=2696054 RepID=A0A967AV37_9FLAO|nr:hypothetical protein [Pelagihabitans pacificus]NHF59725.1 hypothetical protein [Pelagihabitans pacificus]